jgi:hypothetical protein
LTVGNAGTIVDMSARGWLDPPSRVMKQSRRPSGSLFPALKRPSQTVDTHPAMKRAREVGMLIPRDVAPRSDMMSPPHSEIMSPPNPG